MVASDKVRLVETGVRSQSVPDATCPSCGAGIPATAGYCGACSSLSAPVCPTCQYRHPENARFCAQCGTKLQRTDDISDASTPLSRAERRQLTVLFCDLVESTLLASRLDPEDMLEVIRSYQSVVSATIHRYGGFFPPNIGD